MTQRLLCAPGRCRSQAAGSAARPGRWLGARHGLGRPATVGRRIVMRAPPPGSFSATMVPPSALTTWATMARPRPEPGRPRACGRAVEAVEDVRQVRLGDARPVVAHDDGALVAFDRHGLAGRAPLAGVVEQVADGPAQAVVAAHDPAGRRVELEVDVLGPPVRVLHGHLVLHQQVEAQRLPGGRPAVAPGQLGQVAHDVGQLLQLHQHVVDQHGAVLGAQLVDPADHLEVGAQAGERRAQLVRGVEHQLALGPAGRLERLEQAVEGASEAARARRDGRARAGASRQSSRPGPRPCR